MFNVATILETGSLKAYAFYLTTDFGLLWCFHWITGPSCELLFDKPLITSHLSLQGRGATSEFSWQRHSRAAMAAAAADASHHITALTPEEEGPRTATKLFGSAVPLPRTERERERGKERERGREEEGEEVGRAGGTECLVCGALFTSQEKLRLHSLSHTGEKPFHCSQPHCPKAFSSKYKLFRYCTLIRPHNSHPFKCSIIQGFFSFLRTSIEPLQKGYNSYLYSSV